VSDGAGEKVSDIRSCARAAGALTASKAAQVAAT